MSALHQPKAFDRRALARSVSRAARATLDEALHACVAATAAAPRIGVTGPPGVGKSSLVARLAQFRAAQAAPLAVIAIDPASPHSCGSLLGDRIRMDAVADDPRIYVRSLSSGQTRDGLSDNLPAILATLDRARFAEIILETVGVGQSEFGVRALVDVELLVVMPGSGDAIQAMKAGILETADIVVVNKADLAGAQRTLLDLRSAFDSRRGVPAPPVVLVRHDDDAGLHELSRGVDRMLARALQPDAAAMRRRRFHRYQLQHLLTRRLGEVLDRLPDHRFDADPAELYRELLAQLTA